jgi:hypothetical protein
LVENHDFDEDSFDVLQSTDNGALGCGLGRPIIDQTIVVSDLPPQPETQAHSQFFDTPFVSSLRCFRHFESPFIIHRFR